MASSVIESWDFRERPCSVLTLRFGDDMAAILLCRSQPGCFAPRLSQEKKAQRRAHAQVAAANLQTTNRRH